MGTWGTGLFSDDMAMDIKDDYSKYIQQDKTPADAVKLLLKIYQPEGSDDEGLFWVYLAVVQWNYGHLTSEIKEKALLHLPSLWTSDLWSKPSEIARRKQVAANVEKKLNSPQPDFKHKKRFRGKRSVWKIGDIYSMQFDDFQSPDRHPRQLKLFEKYFKYSNQFGAFHIVGIEKVFDPDREVFDECPVAMIYDWVGDHRPSLEDLAEIPFIFYQRGIRIDKGYYNGVCGVTPCKNIISRNNIEFVGHLDLDMSLYEVIFPKCIYFWSEPQVFLMENHIQEMPKVEVRRKTEGRFETTEKP